MTINEDGGESTEPEHADKTLFFGGQTNETPGNYTVNAIDVEELRRSQRRPRPNDLATNPSQVFTLRVTFVASSDMHIKTNITESD